MANVFLLGNGFAFHLCRYDNHCIKPPSDEGGGSRKRDGGRDIKYLRWKPYIFTKQDYPSVALRRQLP